MTGCRLPLLLLPLIDVVVLLPSPARASIFVAANHGGCSDAGAGTQAAPLCTIAAALAKSRASADNDVVLRAGTFTLTSALRLTEADSGLTLRAFGKERVAVSGGMVVTGWKESATKGIWSAPIPASCKCAVGGVCGASSCMAYSSPRQLYVNGRRANRTSANASTLLGGMRLSETTPVATPPQTPAALRPTSTNGGGAYVVAKPALKGWGSSAAGLASTGMEFVYPAQIEPWTEPRCGIKSISADGLTLHMQDCLQNLAIKPGCASGPTANMTLCPLRWFMAGLPGLMENALELLTPAKPGQFYVDRTTATVHYVPHASEDLKTLETVLPLLETLLDSDGANGLTISGIDWTYSAWGGPDQPSGYLPMQAGWNLRPVTEPHSLGPILPPPLPPSESLLTPPRRRLVFSPPVMLGPAKGTANNYYSVTPKVFIGNSGGDNAYTSVDGGAAWNVIPRNANWLPAQHDCTGRNCSAGKCATNTTPELFPCSCSYPPYCGFYNPSGIIGGAFFPDPSNSTHTVRNFGYPLSPILETKQPCRSLPETNDSWYSCYTGFTTPSYMAYSIDATTGLLRQTHHDKVTTFTGLPAAVTQRGDEPSQSQFVSDFGKDNGGVTRLDDGTMVMTLDVRWGFDRGAGPGNARLQDLTIATSVSETPYPRLVSFCFKNLCA